MSTKMRVVLAVLTVCVILMVILILPFMTTSFKNAQTTTQCHLLGRLIEGSMKQYAYDLNRDYEACIQEDGKLIMKNPEGHFLDFWGHALNFDISSTENGIVIIVTSTGEDGILSTVDDIQIQRIIGIKNLDF